MHISEIMMLGQFRQRRIAQINARAIQAREGHVRHADLHGLRRI
jgi:hypothetical protein